MNNKNNKTYGKVCQISILLSLFLFLQIFNGIGVTPVSGFSPTNLAIGCEVSSGTGTALYANDDNLQTVWQAANATPGQWWMIDLGRTHANLESMEIDWSVSAVYKYKILYSPDNVYWSVLADKSGNADSEAITVINDLQRATYVRNVRIEFTEGSALPAIQEVKIFGENWNLPKNASFDANTLVDWQTDNTNAAKVQSSGARSGNMLRITNTSAYTANVSQCLDGVRSGIYSFSAWVKVSGVHSQRYMYVRTSGMQQQVDITSDPNVWKRIGINDISVTDGNCEIGFYDNGSANAAINIEDVVFGLERSSSSVSVDVNMTYSAAKTFSTVQGVGNWLYEKATAGDNNYSDLNVVSGVWGSGPVIEKNEISVTSSTAVDGIRAFVAPYSGTIRISYDSEDAYFYSEDPNGNTNFKILKDNNQLFPDTAWLNLTGGVSKGVLVPDITLNVKRGETIYYRVNAGKTATSKDLLRVKPIITYIQAYDAPPFINNPLNLNIKETEYLASYWGSTEGAQTADTLQLAKTLNLADITLDPSGSGVSAIADANSFYNNGSGILVSPSTAESANIDITFGHNYHGNRILKDIHILTSAVSDSSRFYDFDVYYSTTQEPNKFNIICTVKNTMVNPKCGMNIRIDGFEGKVKDFCTIRIVVHKLNGGGTTIGEVDINDDGDDTADGVDALVAAKKQEQREAIKLQGIFSDNMVLQRGKPVKIWGKGGIENKNITVSFNGQSKTGVVSNGAWEVILDPMTANDANQPLTITCDTLTKRFNNVAVGEVWLAGGQSNMELSFNTLATDTANYASTDRAIFTNWINTINTDPSSKKVRLFLQSKNGAEVPLEDPINGSWKAAFNNSTLSNFSAIGGMFAYKMAKDMNVPVGIISSYCGSSSIITWLGNDALKGHPDEDDLLAKKHYFYEIGETEDYFKQRPNMLYNGMVAPLAPYSLAGILYYQGEADKFDPETYKMYLAAHASNLRRVFEQDDMLFLNVLLAPYSSDYFPDLRNAQLWSNHNIPNYCAINGIDLVDKKYAGQIHPPNKEPISDRLLRAAKALKYGENIVYKGPHFKNVKREGNKLIVSFMEDTLGDGLRAKGQDGSLLPDGNLLAAYMDANVAKTSTFFKVGTDPNHLVDAQAVIHGNTVEVWADSVTIPSFVSFANDAWIQPILYNSAGLPADPFEEEVLDQGIQMMETYFTNENDVKIPHLLAGGKLKAKLKLSNNTSSDAGVTVILAHYDGSNKLMNITMKPVFIRHEDYEYVAIEYPGNSLPSDIKGHHVKIFVWDGLGEMAPVGSRVSIDDVGVLTK